MDVHDVFRDLSKAFDRVWYDDLPYKLKSNATDGNLLKIIKLFLNKRCQRVALNFQSSVEKLVTSGLPQGSRATIFSHLHQ